MKSIKQTQQKEDEYPKLMETDGCVILFTADMCGMVIHVGENGKHRSIGEMSSCWNMTLFKKFEGSLVLSN